MHRHLVAIKIGVECRTDQGVQLNRLALDQNRLKRLNPQAVQRRRPIEQHRMLADDLIENIPNFGALSFHHFLGLLHCAGEAPGL